MDGLFLLVYRGGCFKPRTFPPPSETWQKKKREEGGVLHLENVLQYFMNMLCEDLNWSWVDWCTGG